MPYASIDELPAAVRDQYGPKQQRAFLAAYTSAYDTCQADGGEDCEQQAFAIGHTAAQGAGDKQALDESGNVTSYDPRYNQPDVDYDPTGGGAGAACSSCRWFDGLNGCHVVRGVTAPNGICEIHDPIARVVDEDASEEGEDETIDTIVDQLVSDGVLAEAGLGKAVRSALKAWTTPDDPLFETPSGFKVRGEQWIAWYTNAYQDRDGEYFATQAIEADVTSMWKAKTFPELWYWHIRGTKHGQATWVGMIGRYAVAVGTFDDTAAAKAFKKRYKAQPHQLSHGFHYDPAQKKEGVYHQYHTFEISPLPAGKEANILTAFAVKSGETSMKLTKEQFQSLADIVGVDEAIKMIGQGYDATKQADEAIAYKAKADDVEADTDDKTVENSLEARLTKMEAMMEKLMGDAPKEDDKTVENPLEAQLRALTDEITALKADKDQTAKSVQGITFADIIRDYKAKAEAPPTANAAILKGAKALMGES